MLVSVLRMTKFVLRSFMKARFDTRVSNGMGIFFRGWHALSSEFYNYALNAEFVYPCILPNSRAETISKLTVHSQFLQNYFARAKIKISSS